MKTKDENLRIEGEKKSYYGPTFTQEILTKNGILFWHYADRIACRIKTLGELYERTIGSSYRRERERFSLSESKNILHIGCGSYPITAMILAEMDDVEIVVIDRDKRSLKRADEVIRRRNLENKIRTDYGNGTNYPLKDFDTIIVSGCSVPKIKVLTYVLKNAQPKTRIIVRASYIDVESLIYSLNLQDDISIVEKMESNPLPGSIWTAYYLVKK